MLRKCLEEKYNAVLEKLNITQSMEMDKISIIIREEIRKFMSSYSNVAIFGNGKHTHMLMADYIYELKNIRYIIDNNAEVCSEKGGYKIIGEDEMERLNIDGVIISSTKYRKEMIDSIIKKHTHTAYLDIYEKFEENGIYLNTSYYNYWYPANHYAQINKLRGEIAKNVNEDEKENLYIRLIKKYIILKDFYSALLCIKNLQTNCDNDKYKLMEIDIQELYQLELQAAADVHTENVLMLCLDGLRRKDYMSGLMPNLKKYCDSNMLFFANAYSCSTSTFESLVPAYSENDDLMTRYFQSNEIAEKDCRFIQEALKQERNIYFYTDAADYIKCDSIKRNNNYLTATEKMWYFLLDAVEEKNGLFYVHVGYESHFPYVNPLTMDGLVSDGTNIMFDYLSRLGGKVRTNYSKQQQDALRYLDYTLTPIIERLKLRTVMFSDHGNILIDKEERLGDICRNKFSFHEDLIQILLAVKMPDLECGQNNKLISLISINDIIISLLNAQKFEPEYKEYVKVERSSIYNLEFQHLYKKADKEQELNAFEAFIFDNGYKLVVYDDRRIDLFSIEDDEQVDDEKKRRMLINKVRRSITVCRGEIL